MAHFVSWIVLFLFVQNVSAANLCPDLFKNGRESRVHLRSKTDQTLSTLIEALRGLSDVEIQQVRESYTSSMMAKGHNSWRAGFQAGLRKENKDINTPRPKPVPKDDAEKLWDAYQKLSAAEQVAFLKSNDLIIAVDNKGKKELHQNINLTPDKLIPSLNLKLNGVHKKFADIVFDFAIAKARAKENVRQSDITNLSGNIHDVWMADASWKVQPVLEKFNISSARFYSMSVEQIVSVCESLVKSNRIARLSPSEIEAVNQFTTYYKLGIQDKYLDDRILADHVANLNVEVQKIANREFIREILRRAKLVGENRQAYLFTKAPILALPLTGSMKDIPRAIVEVLGKKDKRAYTPEYIQENAGSAIAIQFDKLGQPDFYVIGKPVFEQKYKSLSTSDVAKVNPTLYNNAKKMLGTLIEGQNLIGIMKPEAVELFTMSSLGYPIDKEITIQTVFGNQTKRAGYDAYLGVDVGTGTYYLVNVDTVTGLPLGYAYAKSKSQINIDVSNDEAMKGEGDFIHREWQIVNSYRTRYKLMKDANGNKITDIQKYIAERQIPAEYHDYYLQMADGTYSEDIKRIPNQWLAANNKAENSNGAASYIKVLTHMSEIPVASVGAAIREIFVGNSQVHVDWYERNSSWTVPNGEPKTFAEAGIETRYNGTLLMYHMAQRHGLTNNPSWKQAFETVVAQLAAEKFKPYRSFSAPAAFLAMTQKVGTKPSIEGDKQVAQFFSEKMPSYKLGASPTNEVDKIHMFLGRFFPEIKGISTRNVRIVEPKTKPGTTARVYYVISEQTDKPFAVLKFQKGEAGLGEVMSTITSEQDLKPTPDMRPAAILAYGKWSADDYFMIQEAAKETEVDRALAEPTSRAHALLRTAKILLGIHRPVRLFPREDLKSIAADLTTFKGNCYYDIREMRRYIPGGKRDAFSYALQNGQTTAQTVETITSKITTITNRYARIVELNPQTLSPTKIHGDMHGGNAFIEWTERQSTVIDYGGLSWFIGKKIGTGDRGNDVGRMVGNILVEGTKNKLHVLEIISLIQNFMDEYRDLVGIQSGSIEEIDFKISVAFYMNRFVAVNAADVNGKKFKPRNGETLQELRQRLFLNWEKVLELLRF